MKKDRKIIVKLSPKAFQELQLKMPADRRFVDNNYKKHHLLVIGWNIYFVPEKGESHE